MQLRDKVAHVRHAVQLRPHACHWPGCTRQVKPAMWGCPEHWFRLPNQLRAALWSAYQPGQEESGRVSESYVRVARDVQRWIHDQGTGQRPLL